MKILALVVVAAFTVGCSSTNERKQMFIEGAETCNMICMNNPEVGEYSYKAGGGMPLLFMGGMEEKCNCIRPQK
ncbi:MAG: hypothetical protein ABFS45_22360 [Pseudomonadota bacterium]